MKVYVCKEIDKDGKEYWKKDFTNVLCCGTSQSEWFGMYFNEDKRACPLFFSK